jgi:hypothetical protein
MLPSNYKNRLPFGVPTHYTMERTYILCGHCGTTSTQHRLLASFRKPNGGLEMRYMGASEQLYADLPLETLDRKGGTPRCEHCIETAPRDKPLELLPEPDAKLKMWRDPKLDQIHKPSSSSSSSSRKPVSTDDLLL